MAASVAAVPATTLFQNVQAMEGKQFDDVSRRLVLSVHVILLNICVV